MAFEVTYSFHEKLDEGGYNVEEQKTLVKRYGKGYEEMTFDRLAANIITQLSRRDIWIVDVKVFEFVKKEVKFKETKGGGIVLGGRKFTLDGSHSLLEEDVEQPQHIIQPQQMIVNNEVPFAHRAANQTPKIIPENRPALRHVIFAPPQELMEFAKVLKLTFNKRYPIYEEKAADMANMRSGMLYYLRDDLGKGIWARSFYFQDTIQLAYETELVAARGASPGQGGGFIDSARYFDDPGLKVPDVPR